nr:MAG: RHH-type transcriptional regulator, rel operon repressor / antitoxin RelB [Candidatus Kentron sp. LFY]VFK16808.1 MAG: RHH-type transcriptional regulator, rel operon repressor / antitoxin RelB [Candidatus Kentron sp. LFY]
MVVSIRFEPEIEQKLVLLAEKADRPMASFLQEIIEQGIEDMEESYLASEILQRVDEGQEKTHSTHDVRVALGLEVSEK